MMVIGYRVPCEGWYAVYAPEGATERQIHEVILDDIVEEAYWHGATLEILWQASDGREGWLIHTIQPRHRG
jgi:hypothetical protein